MKKAAFRTLVIVFLTLSGAIMVFPFLLMSLTSLKEAREIVTSGLNILPLKPTLQSYVRVFADTLMVRFLINGVIVTAATLAGQLFLSIPAAFVFARRRFPLKKTLFGFVLAALVFPRYIAAIPNFLLLSGLGLINTYVALIVPSLASSFCIFLLRQFMMTIPQDFIDAAEIEGCGILRMIYQIMVPMIRPAIGSFAIFSVVMHWNDFFWPLIVVRSKEMFTPPAGIVFFADSEGASDWGAIMAASVLIITPLIAFFLSSRRQFIASLTHTGLK
jgi:multiple sugar transport system permease protein